MGGQSPEEEGELCCLGRRGISVVTEASGLRIRNSELELDA